MLRKWGGVKLFDNQHFKLMIGRRVLNNQLIENGKFPVYSANVFEPFGNIDTLLIEDFSSPSIIWGIDGDWMVNYIPEETPFYPTDHCGVLRVNSDSFNAHFVKFMLVEAGKRAGFSRSYRASIERVESLLIPKLPLIDQNILIEKVEKLQVLINNLETQIPLLEEKQNKIIKDIILN